jgi:hypothetical protein
MPLAVTYTTFNKMHNGNSYSKVCPGAAGTSQPAHTHTTSINQGWSLHTGQATDGVSMG